jgi:hypothetical protein
MHIKAIMKCKELYLSVERQEKTIKELILDKEELLSTVFTLQEEDILLDSKLTNLTKTIRMMNKGTEMLDQMLEAGRRVGDMKGLGFDSSYKEKAKTTSKKEDPSKKKCQKQMSNQTSHHLAQQPAQHPAKFKNLREDNTLHHHDQHKPFYYKDKKEPTKRCSYCRGYGHTRSEYFKIYGYPQKIKKGH